MIEDERANIFSRLGALEAGQNWTHERLESIDAKLDSLIDSRSFIRGAWRGIVMIAGAVSTLVALVIAWAKGH